MEGVGKRDDCSYLKNRELSNDGDGSENVAKKLNLPHFKMLSRLFGASKFAVFVKCR